MSEDSRTHYRLCSTCKKPLPFGSIYYRCSVSTCNRKGTTYTFCSVECWDAHVPTMRHKDAWAEELRAPSKETYIAQWNEERKEHMSPEKTTETLQLSNAISKDTLIVASKLKAYIKARGNLRTSDGVMDRLSDVVRKLVDEAMQRAHADGRQTVMDRDIAFYLEHTTRD